MPQAFGRSSKIYDDIRENMTLATFQKRLESTPPAGTPLPKRIPAGNDCTGAGMQQRQAYLRDHGIKVEALAGQAPPPEPEKIKGNIENLIGFCQVPVGVIGPLRINGLHAHGDFFVPMATTEGALVASYNRGAYVISQAGGASALCLTESVSRAPCFLFHSLAETCLFLSWIYDQYDTFHDCVSATTSHGQLIDMKTSVNGPAVYLIFDYTTGDAAGQNMVTVATEAICQKIIAETPVSPHTWYLEGNLSGDKKASMLSFLGARGKKVVAEALLPEKIIRKFLHSSPAAMARYCKMSTLGGIQSGCIGVQGHFANALAGLFIACGQDAACVSEAAIGITDMEVTANNDLHVSVSLPNLTVGTVGGGTHLPTAKECLAMMDCYGEGKARKFAEICAVTAMAGEISIIAALAAGDFGQAHATYRHKG
jgi:hydroxymethylglutaryl-CoA reductase (NADPH)